MKCELKAELNVDETALFRHVYGIASRLLPEYGRLEPVAFFRAGESARIDGMESRQVVTVGLGLPASDHGKDAVADDLRQMVRKTEADLVIVLMESWMVKPSREDAWGLREGRGMVPIRPSEHPNRVEIVFVSVSKPGGHHWTACIPIQRNGNGHPTLPEEPPGLEYMEVGGRFANLFAEPCSA